MKIITTFVYFFVCLWYQSQIALQHWTSGWFW